jgi:hypothetical protein
LFWLGRAGQSKSTKGSCGITQLHSASKFTKLELQIMQALWDSETASIREIQEAFPNPAGPLIQPCTPPYTGSKERTRQLEDALLLGDPITELTIAMEVD